MSSAARAILSRLSESGLTHEPVAAPIFADEPKVPGFFCMPRETHEPLETTRSSGFGTHRSPAIARIKATAECLEGLCLYNPPAVGLDEGRFEDAGTQTDPLRFFDRRSTLAESAAEECRASTFRWWRAERLGAGPTLIPAQTVFNARFLLREFALRAELSSTGAALGERGRGRALESGLLEVIERDALVRVFHGRRPFTRIIDLPAGVEQLVATLKRYRLEPHVFDVASELDVPTILVITIDRTGAGPAVCAGAAADFRAARAIEKAILESIQNRGMLRIRRATDGAGEKLDASEIRSTSMRQRFWADPDRIADIERWFELANTKRYSDSTWSLLDVAALTRQLEKRGFEVFVADITLPAVERQGFEVLKVVCPDLLPMYMDERAQVKPRLTDSEASEEAAWHLPTHPFA